MRFFDPAETKAWCESQGVRLTERGTPERPSSHEHHVKVDVPKSFTRLRHPAPGHFFLRNEGPDLVSLLQIGILCGWDMHLVPEAGNARAFLSHDEYVEFAADPHLVKEFAGPLTKDSTDEGGQRVR